MQIDVDFARALIDFHVNPTDDPLAPKSLSPRLLRMHASSLLKLFHDFAKDQPEFVLLEEREQNLLLQRGAPLFIQYFIGR